jgi:hypothetical protein
MSEALLPLHIDSTMISCFRSCAQKFFQEFILGRRPSATSIDLHFGAVFSRTLEHFYRQVWEQGIDPRTALDRCLIFFQNEWGDAAPTRDSSPKTKENCWDALESYVSTYPPHSDHVQPLLVSGRASFEFSFAIPLADPSFPRHPSGDPFIYVGRADLLGEHKALPVIRDEKTASRLDSNWSDHWNLRSQFLGYCWAAQQGGIPVENVVVRGIIVKKKSPCVQVEAIKPYSKMLIARWYEQLRRDLHRLVEMWEYGSRMAALSGRQIDGSSFDYNLGETCTQYGLCPYMDLCKSPNPDRWASNYVVRRWNPLERNPLPVGTSSSNPEGESATSLAPA